MAETIGVRAGLMGTNVGSREKQLANQGFTWEKGQNGQWMRSDAYNPDTGEFYFPDLNQGQTISPKWGGSQQQSSGGFSVGGASQQSAQQTSPQSSPTGGLVQGVNVNQYQQNPYLSQMGDVLTGRVNDNLQRQIMPGIRSNAVAAGGFGGSRQGVVEANAMKDANQTISDALTGAYFQDFTNQMNRNLAQYGQNQNFFSNQRGQDLQQLALGANLFQQGNQGWLSQGQGLLGLGQTQQQAPWQVINNANAGLGQWSGYGTTTSANQGGGAQGVLGGAMAGGQLGSLWGGAGINSSSTPYIPSNGGLPFNALT